ncbi:MAG TPA: type II toxin-antitoxin system mRNA interferase toxin, RelE/StbE family [Synergistaceae bacterium]|jgi:mRNA interferase YafQ|nr:type II toxin-antitoxin system mRNA interferase toxin, RelE/StbE family [Synergistaceae bacterium]
MRSIRQTAAFKRDFKRVSKGTARTALKERFMTVVSTLAEDEALPLPYRDHALGGNWHGHRECHITPDLILLYYTAEPDQLVLVRLGSHAEIFGF